MGHAPSIMDYSRFSCVAQPGGWNSGGGPRLSHVLNTLRYFRSEVGLYAVHRKRRPPRKEKATRSTKWARVQDTTLWAALLNRRRSGLRFWRVDRSGGSLDAIKSTAAGGEEPAACGEDAAAAPRPTKRASLTKGSFGTLQPCTRAMDARNERRRDCGSD